LGQISVEEHSKEDDFEWSFSGVDLRDSFYQLGWDSMSEFFCLRVEGTCEEFCAESVFDPLSRTSSKAVPGEMVFPALAVA
jgi:hypothetical protein